MRSFDGRWDEHKLTADAYRKIRYEYYVSGRGAFPIDMLRHDAAWPAGSEDAAKIEWTFIKRHDLSIRLRSHSKPNIDRWSSFGWSVGFAAVVA